MAELPRPPVPVVKGVDGAGTAGGGGLEHFRRRPLPLIGWALGSVTEGLASVTVIWRFTGTRTLSQNAEARAQQGVAVSFFLLAPYIAIKAVRNLLVAHQGGTNRLGVIVTAASLLVMPALGFTKQPTGKGCRT
jgi:hypothetical protein